jgi:hypothetical protein
MIGGLKESIDPAVGVRPKLHCIHRLVELATDPQARLLHYPSHRAGAGTAGGTDDHRPWRQVGR